MSRRDQAMEQYTQQRRRLVPAAVLIVLVTLLCVSPARAEFGGIRRVYSDTAWTLDEGEMTVGILGPLRYGILDDLMVVTHPILHLLLTPNLSFRFKAYDGPVAVAMNVSYVQTFLDSTKKDFPGTLSVYPMVTIPIASRVAITGQVGYILDVQPRHDGEQIARLSHGMLYGGGVNALVTDSDLLSLSVQDEYYFDIRGIARPVVILAYTHAFFRMRIKVGVAVGNFPIDVGTATSADNGIEKDVPRIKEIPVYPVLDLWWQL